MKTYRFNYDIHGIITVGSDCGLPELERFSVTELSGDPFVKVNLGRVPTRVANGLSTVSQVVYREALGSAGFATAITYQDTGVEVIASPVLRFSPHVLYTNIVEPILRWSFVEKGYCLVHGACLAENGNAYLITARTDTGKTTTMLKILDSQPTWSFLSDDLTLIDRDGNVFSYPKPLTISRHTLVAVKTPLLSRKERLGLVIQSRLHSKSGRWFGLFLTKTHLPMASTNALVQFLVPPPKYHVGRLVPGVTVDKSSKLAGLVVIDRQGEGQINLDPVEALETLLANCDDAYGFPPYHSIKQVLYTRNGVDLRDAEREIVRSALDGKPATLLRSTTRDWYKSLPALVSARARKEITVIEAPFIGSREQITVAVS